MAGIVKGSLLLMDGFDADNFYSDDYSINNSLGYIKSASPSADYGGDDHLFMWLFNGSLEPQVTGEMYSHIMDKELI